MLIACDVSYYQPKVDSSYPREWLIFRCCDGDFLDPNATFNADWSRGAVVQGRMVGWTAYVVYRPGRNAAVLANLRVLGLLDRVMIDIESWSGAIRGDHSGEINQLVQGIQGLGVPFTSIWRYGNQSDLASIHPQPLAGQLTVVAAYQPSRPTGIANLVGWQYSNGVENHTGNPTTSAPFGACDHNELYVDELSPSGGGTPIGGDVPLTGDDLTAISGVVVNVIRSDEFKNEMNTLVINVVRSDEFKSEISGLVAAQSFTAAQLATLADFIVAKLPPAAANLTKQDVHDVLVSAIKVGP